MLINPGLFVIKSTYFYCINVLCLFAAEGFDKSTDVSGGITLCFPTACLWPEVYV